MGSGERGDRRDTSSEDESLGPETSHPGISLCGHWCTSSLSLWEQVAETQHQRQPLQVSEIWIPDKNVTWEGADRFKRGDCWWKATAPSMRLKKGWSSWGRCQKRILERLVYTDMHSQSFQAVAGSQKGLQKLIQYREISGEWIVSHETSQSDPQLHISSPSLIREMAEERPLASPSLGNVISAFGLWLRNNVIHPSPEQGK